MSHYETLGVASTATDDEIKAAYRRLAMQHHPDRGGSGARFHEIQHAFEHLMSRKCPECGGRGEVRVYVGAFSKLMKCPRCWAGV